MDEKYVLIVSDFILLEEVKISHWPMQWTDQLFRTQKVEWV